MFLSVIGVVLQNYRTRSTVGVSMLLQLPFSVCKWSTGSKACSDGLCIFTAKWDTVGRYPIAFSSLFDGHLGGFQVFFCFCFFALINSAAMIILEAPGNLGIWI